MKTRGLLLGALGAALAVALLSVGAAQAQSIRTNGGVASALVCLLTGGAGCTMTGSTIYSGVTNDITTAGVENLTVAPGGNFVVTSGGNSNTFNANTQCGSLFGCLHMNNANGVFIGATANRTATQVSVALADVVTSGSGGTPLLSVYGGGILRAALPQAAACSAGVLALDPTSSVINLDANGAACVVTLAETTAATVTPGFDVQINIVTSAGAGTVTFPDVANIHDGPALCTTTGLALNGSYRIHYADMANDMFIGTSCSAN